MCVCDLFFYFVQCAVHVCVCLYVRCVRARVCVRLRARVRVRVSMRLRVRVRVCVRACLTGRRVLERVRLRSPFLWQQIGDLG